MGVTEAILLSMLLVLVSFAAGDDTNHVFQPCADPKVQRSDGFTLGIALAPSDSFSFNGTRLSPCDRRLGLASNQNSRLVVFRPQVDQISILTVSSTPSTYINSGGSMVAFAGRKYAARSVPAFVGNSTYTVTSFSLVLEFQKGTLQNLYWKKGGCDSCKGNPSFVCLNKQECAIKTSKCKGWGGSDDCSLGIQVSFSGTDKHLKVLNSWYEFSNIRQYSLFNLYSNLRDSFGSLYNKHS